MAIEAFSDDWAREWCRILGERVAYREAAARWEGAVALIMTQNTSEGAPSRAVYLDLWHGECKDGRLATQKDLDTAQYVLTGTARAWRDVLSGNVAPLQAMMTGKIRLARGSMSALVPMAGAARELVAAAMDMPVDFPEGWL